MVHLSKLLKSTLVAALLLTTFNNYAQQIEVGIEFTQYQTEYTPLETADTLTGKSNNWGGDTWIMGLDSAVQYSGMEGFPFQKLGIGTHAQMALWNQFTADPYELDLYMTPFQSNVTAPGRDHLNDDFGAILYYDGGDHHIIEFRNVALTLENIIAAGRLRTRINYMIEIDPANNSLRYIYGPSTIHHLTEDYFSEHGTICGMVFEIWKDVSGGGNFEMVENLYYLLEGSPQNPSINKGSDIDNPIPDSGLNAFPPEGTVYEFQFSSISSTVEDTYPEPEVKVFPNPGVDRLHLTGNRNEWSDRAAVAVYNSSGIPMYQNHPGESAEIHTQNWPSGLYLIRVTDKDFRWEGKWVKK